MKSKEKENKKFTNKRCFVCGKELRYHFEIENGICEDCQLSKNKKVKTFEQFKKLI